MTVTDLTSMTAMTTPVGTDIVYAVSDPGGSPVPRKITVDDLLARAYGGILLDDGAAVQALTGGAWTKVTQFDEDSGMTVSVTESHSNDKLTPTVSGIFEVSFSASFTTGAASVIDLAVYWNGAITKIRGEATSQNGTDVINVAASGRVNVSSASTDIELYVNGSVSDDFGATQLSLHCKRIDP